MTSILLVAHAPLATTLLAVAKHTYPDCSGQLSAIDVVPGASLDDTELQIAAALAALPDPDVLILADVFGATPGNAALKAAAAAASGQRRRLVTGLNVPMLWRTLCYGRLSLDELVARAVDGGRQGIMQPLPRPPQQWDPLESTCRHASLSIL